MRGPGRSEQRRQTLQATQPLRHAVLVGLCCLVVGASGLSRGSSPSLSEEDESAGGLPFSQPPLGEWVVMTPEALSNTYKRKVAFVVAAAVAILLTAMLCNLTGKKPQVQPPLETRPPSKKKKRKEKLEKAQFGWERWPPFPQQQPPPSQQAGPQGIPHGQPPEGAQGPKDEDTWSLHSPSLEGTPTYVSSRSACCLWKTRVVGAANKTVAFSISLPLCCDEKANAVFCSWASQQNELQLGGWSRLPSSSLKGRQPRLRMQAARLRGEHFGFPGEEEQEFHFPSFPQELGFLGRAESPAKEEPEEAGEEEALLPEGVEAYVEDVSSAQEKLEDTRSLLLRSLRRQCGQKTPQRQGAQRYLSPSSGVVRESS
ncbi:hypothetical protein Efla_002684 [Eimeria flavescens]